MRYSERIIASSKPGKYFLLLIFFSLLLAISAMAQTKEEKKMRLKAVKALNAGNFIEAQDIYADLLKLDSENPDYNYEMGLAIFEEGTHRGKAAPYFVKAIENTKSDTLPDMFLYAGKAEQYAGNFASAIDYFEQYKLLLRAEDIQPGEWHEDVDRYIQMSENGKVQFENSKQYIRIENMGEAINSPYPDYSPVVTNDEQMMLFTSRRENTTGGLKDDDDKYFEDIYFSLNIDGTWTQASNADSTNRFMNDQVNTPMHDATITYAGDETQLFIYRNLDVWVSKLENGLWTIPVKATGRVNSNKGFEPSVFITQDEKTMFVVSDLNTGFGGRDIYVTTKDSSGNWLSLKNLGRTINTKADEDAPFLTPDGNTLYFSSKGHNSMGDYDIFKSVLNEQGEWSTPENLGPPINTSGHDRYFVTTDNGAVGYYASDREGGFGETDIYRIVLDCKSVSSTKIKGMVYSDDKKSPVGATIIVFDPKTNVIIRTFKAEAKTGKYEMRLKTENTYGFKIEAEGYLPHLGTFTVPQQCDYYYLYQEIKIDNLEDSTGRVYAQRAFINNAFFDVDHKVSENFAGVNTENLSEAEQDSLRNIVTEKYNPIEITNYVKTVDVIDAKGNRLASETIGDKPVSVIQAKEETRESYMTQVLEGDKYFYNGNLAEARAQYLIARQINPDDPYALRQIELIDAELKDAPQEAFLATVDEGETAFVMPVLIDSAQFIAMGGDLALIAAAQQEKDTTGEKPVATIETETEEPVALTEPAEPETVETESIEEAAAEEAEIPAEDVAAATPQDETIVFRNILFDFDKSALREASKEELNKIHNYMSVKPQVEIQIDGHADWIGTVEYNMALSERRAKSAYGYLVEKGITEERVTYQYFGESVPIAPNANEDGTDNPEGRQLNRRCEFKIDQKGTAENVVLKF